MTTKERFMGEISKYLNEIELEQIEKFMTLLAIMNYKIRYKLCEGYAFNVEVIAFLIFEKDDNNYFSLSFLLKDKKLQFIRLLILKNQNVFESSPSVDERRYKNIEEVINNVIKIL